VRVPVGATLVRGSDAPGEVRETYAKAAGVLRAFGVDFGHLATGRPAAVAAPSAGPAPARSWSEDPEIAAVLAARNDNLSPFWRTEHAPGSLAVPELSGRRVLIIDNEDAFTSMLAVQLRALGLAVVRTPYDEVRTADLEACDLVVLGPGPGDPRDTASPRIGAVREYARDLLAECRPVLGVCLGHQALSLELGLEVRRLPLALQGTQYDVDLFGSTETVAFYNSFAAVQPEAPVLDVRTTLIPGGPYVAAMRGPSFGGIQFHPESILTLDGLGVLRREIGRLVVPA
jgi:phenazine biosynthesis protein phzE